MFLGIHECLLLLDLLDDILLQLLFLQKLVIDSMLGGWVNPCLDSSAVTLLLPVQERLDILVFNGFNLVENVGICSFHLSLDVVADPDGTLNMVHQLVSSGAVLIVLVVT